MGLIYLFLKIFPIFGLALAIVCVDLARNFKRKANKTWVGMLVFAAFFLALTGVWFFFRGDKNADLWFQELIRWLHAK
jgi:hypothetical protein